MHDVEVVVFCGGEVDVVKAGAAQGDVFLLSGSTCIDTCCAGYIVYVHTTPCCASSEQTLASQRSLTKMHTASWPLANTAVVASSRASRYVNSRPESVAFAAWKDSLSYCLFTLVNGYVMRGSRGAVVCLRSWYRRLLLS
jgi:hypothetical protein